MSKTINIFGAFDRYNYGDLLFPIVISEYIKRYKPELLNEYSLNYYGLIKSDLSSIGGVKTKAYSELISSDIENGSIVIVAGGEVLTSRITSLYLDLSNSFFEYNIKHIMRKILPNCFFESFLCKKFGTSKFPFIIDLKDYKNKIKIIYNAVGGAEYLNKLDKDSYNYIINNLKRADYLAVREEDSHNNLKNIGANLFPDSAVLISELFPVELLEKECSETVLNFVSKTKKYICIETNLRTYKTNKNDFLNGIRDIIKYDKNVEVLLLPIGYATQHDDRVALEDIYKNINKSVSYIEELNIYEIMYLIAKSNLFVGTSLHGNITAMSFLVPHIGLTKARVKLDSYLRTWDIQKQNHCIEVSELFDFYKNLPSINQNELAIKRNELMELARKNMDNIISIIE